MTRIHFYAFKNDLLTIMFKFEADQPVVYHKAEMLDEPSPKTYSSASELPRLGEAAGDQQVLCDAYLVLPAGTEVVIRTSVMFNGVRRFDVDQLANSDSIVMNVGGRWGENSLIAGIICTVSDSALAQKMMRSAHRAIKKHFNRIGGYWVGPDALAALRAGNRLCFAIQSPPEYDLREVAEDKTAIN